MSTLLRTLLCTLLAAVPATGFAQEPVPQDAPKPQAPKPLARLPIELMKKQMPDGVWMAADHYEVGADARKPGVIVVCLHMAAGSRGEYRKIAPEFVKLGCAVLAVDLRSGGKLFDVENMTVKDFSARNKRQVAQPADAYGDVGFAVDWARELAPGSKVVLLASSTSTTLALAYAGREPGGADMLLMYSPGEYIKGFEVVKEAKNIRVPVFLTCGNEPQERGPLQLIAAAIDPALVTTFVPPADLTSEHGAITLRVMPLAHRQKHWDEVVKMLERLK